jgi:hypothetical protein
MLISILLNLILPVIPKPVWAVGFALEQTLRDAALAVFRFADFKTASAYHSKKRQNCLKVVFCAYSDRRLIIDNLIDDVD